MIQMNPEDTIVVYEQPTVTNKKPLKSKNLKIIDHIGTLYATFDGSNIWKIDKSISYIIALCDGNRTVEQIAEEISKEIEMKVDDVKSTLINILSELEKKNFIEYSQS
jgi:uncharacterized protein Yka (UPF0111/DUF47 family)